MQNDQTEPAKDEPDTGISAPNETESNPVEHTPTAVGTATKRPWFKRPFWPIFLILALLVAGALIYWRIGYQPKAKPLISSHTKPKIKTSTPALAQTSLYKTPRSIAPINLFSNYSDVFGQICTGAAQSDCRNATINDLTFYQIGETAQKQAIDVVYAPFTASTDGIRDFVFVADQPNHYTVYEVYSWASNEKALSNVSIDSSNYIPGVSFPGSVTIGQYSLSLPSYDNVNAGYFINGLSDIMNGSQPVAAADMRKIGTYQGIDYYEDTIVQQPSFKINEIGAAIGGVIGNHYQLNDPIFTTNTPPIKWNDGSYNKAQYNDVTPGCGTAYGFAVVNNVDPASLSAVGSLHGTTLYQLPDNQPFVQYMYNQVYQKGWYLDDKSLQNLSLSQFQNLHTVVVAKNAAGEYQAYINNNLFIYGGCGKPVIYLYPTHKQAVDVKVGAVVTKSNPTYNQANGWDNVIAEPNGQLTYHGKRYPSLFWEGKGTGAYPIISSGSVVKQTDLITTIKNQLEEQGLNAKETSQFLDFWKPRLPKTAYVRLTWFDTQQMNTLAPLTINPAPKTLIRTFLDFGGLNKPIKLTPQTFTKPVRNGFTVVEWGGLLTKQ